MSIKTSNLGVSIGKHRIFCEISLTCEKGQLTALLGPSGSGKTTLLNCLGLLLRPTSGTIHIDDESVTNWKNRRRERFWQQKAAFIYQDYGLIDEETLAYNVTLRMTGLLRRRPPKNARLSEVLEAVGLAGREDDHTRVLSGGEKQRAGVARAMYKNASYIFADEPTASLDADNRRTVTALLADAASRGACVVIATHDETLAAAADQTYVL